jgi:hypothetical protein
MKTTKTQEAQLKSEIEKALSSNAATTFEDIPGEAFSPLNQPVVEKNIHADKAFMENNEGMQGEDDTVESQDNPVNEPLDAPEQHIGNQDENAATDAIPEMPLSHAQITADAILGATDNLLEVGGGFFLRIRKHDDFYDFDEEIIQVIDDQNQKNIKLLKLEPDDKAMLRPLMIVVIRKRAKTLSPEELLAGAILSILIKKAQMIIQVRAENDRLVERIRAVFKKPDESNEERTSSKDQNQTSVEGMSQMGAVLETA